jgi:hypothetical protein
MEKSGKWERNSRFLLQDIKLAHRSLVLKSTLPMTLWIIRHTPRTCDRPIFLASAIKSDLKGQ